MYKIYTSSTCAPCKALKARLELKGIAPEYVSVDDLSRDELPKGLRIVPTLVTTAGICIVGDGIEEYIKTQESGYVK